MPLQFVYTFFATISFAYIFNAPHKSIFVTGLIGSSGWLLYSFFQQLLSSDILGSFIGTLGIALLSELAARRYKMPVTVFLTTGIISLVPGSGLYSTMLYLVQNNYTEAVKAGTETIFIAGAISVAIAISSTVFRKRQK